MSQEQELEQRQIALYERMIEDRLDTISPLHLRLALAQVRTMPGLVSVGLPSGRAVRFSPMAEAVLHVTLTDIADAERAYLQPVTDPHPFETFRESEESLQAASDAEGGRIPRALQVRVPEAWKRGTVYELSMLQKLYDVEPHLPPFIEGG